MEPTARFVPRSEDVACEEFDGEFVVLDLSSGKYFALAGGSAIVWRGLMSGHSTETLCAELPPGDPRRGEVAGLIESLIEHRVIVVSSEPAPEAPKDVAFELAGARAPFSFEMLDDLADLLLADPIHDVDPESGWPILLTKHD